jgi:hypothetical protein
MDKVKSLGYKPYTLKLFGDNVVTFEVHDNVARFETSDGKDTVTNFTHLTLE